MTKLLGSKYIDAVNLSFTIVMECVSVSRKAINY